MLDLREVWILTLAYLALIVAPLGAGVSAVLALRKHRRLWTPSVMASLAGIFVAILMNPISQVLVLEGFDTARGAELARKAQAAGLVGLGMDKVVKLYGSPLGGAEYSPGTMTWEYKQLPGYWMGSHFQIFFKSGKVVGFEPNDD
jgi:hypothetical protein